jgi:signal transduction histidine kinase
MISRRKLVSEIAHGLALARKFVQLHGGKIGVTSELGKGSTFTFSLLNCPPPAAASNA